MACSLRQLATELRVPLNVISSLQERCRERLTEVDVLGQFLDQAPLVHVAVELLVKRTTVKSIEKVQFMIKLQ